MSSFRERAQLQQRTLWQQQQQRQQQMQMQEALTSSGVEALTTSDDVSLPIVKVRASVVFAILSSFIRRSDKHARVIGTLLGVVREGNVVEVMVLSVQSLWFYYFIHSFIQTFIHSLIAS